MNRKYHPIYEDMNIEMIQETLASEWNDQSEKSKKLALARFIYCIHHNIDTDE